MRHNVINACLPLSVFTKLFDILRGLGEKIGLIQNDGTKCQENSFAGVR
jgi:hypothetical protein